MARIEFGRLSAASRGEASDFTPLLAEQLDALGEQINIGLISIGESEVPTTGGRRIDIVAQSGDGLELVVENQYGRADHDHLTRGLAYAVARHVVLLAPGPSGNGRRTVVAIYADARVLVPFASYAGSNSGIPIEALTSEEFWTHADTSG